MKIKLTLFWSIVIILLPNIFLFAQSSDWQWIKSYGGTGHDNCRTIKADNNGNIYMLGVFQSPSIAFDSITLTGGSFTSFVVKINSLGIAEWGKTFPSDCYVHDMALDDYGNLLMVGMFNSSNVTFGNVTLVNQGGNDVFILKYDSSGNVIWAKRAGSLDNEDSRSITSDNYGNVFITGEFLGHSFTIDNITLVNTGAGNTGDIFVAGYDMNGNILWAKTAGGIGYERSNSVKANAVGDVYITGCFDGNTMTFDSETLSNISNEDDVFIAMYDATNGNLEWSRSAGGNDIDVGYSITTDSAGDAYICGEYYDAPITFNTTTLALHGAADVFTVKYDRSGNLIWGKGFGGSASDYPGYINIDINGNLYITSSFFSTSIIFGNGVNISNPYSSENMYMVKMTSVDGTILWARSIGGIDTESGASITANSNGDVYAAGNFMSYTVNIDSTILTNVGQTNTFDIFLTKLSLTAGANNLFKPQNIFSVYPNPSSGSFIIHSEAEMVNCEISILNLLGEKLFCEKFSGTEKSIFVDYAKGVYIVDIKNENGNFKSKIVIR